MEVFLPLLVVALVLTIGLCCLFLFTIQPIWAIIDVAVSEKHSGVARAVVIVLTIFPLGPVMSFLYACFGTYSKALRRTTVLAALALVCAGGAALGLAIGVPAARTFWPKPGKPGGEVVAVQGRQAAALGSLDPFPSGEVASFKAIHLVPKDSMTWAQALADFDGHGPNPQSLIPITVTGPYPVTHLAIDPEGPVYYALTTHEVGKIVPNTGHFVPLELDPAAGKPSWPSAIAFDTSQRVLLVVARSQGYSFRPSTGEWRKLPALKDDDLVGLAYSPEKKMLYALRSRAGGELATGLVTLNADGALLGQTDLSAPIPIGQYPFCLAQLCWSGNQLIVLVSPRQNAGAVSASMYCVEPKTGVCRVVQ